jgi:hypothetical protein
MGVRRLRNEVARRQAAVLRPQAQDERAMSVHQRQRRLRVARSVLAGRLQAGEAEGGGGDGGQERGAAAARAGGELELELEGGFVRPTSGADDDGVGRAARGPGKRQRLE